MSTRRATHAGSWYSKDPAVLAAELQEWLAAVGDGLPDVPGAASLPVPGARIIIAPHAGYSYSGPAAAYAYKSWDLSKAKRVFLLGPSHHLYLDTLAVTTCSTLDTPLGPLTVDTATTETLKNTPGFTVVPLAADEAEHSLEMHLPYIHTMLTLAGKPETPIVPLMVGALGRESEKVYGQALAPMLADPETAWVVSTDFCHWGTRFDYTHYYPVLPTLPPMPRPPTSDIAMPSTLEYPVHVRLGTVRRRGGPEVWESVAVLDRQGMKAVATGRHDVFVDYLARTRNTVCGRHPIGVVMAAVEAVLGAPGEEERGAFRWVRYEQSGEVMDVGGSSVSYASAFSVL